METLVDSALLNALLVIPLALVAAVVAHLVRRPALAHALWLLVLLKLLTPPLIFLSVPRADEAIPDAAVLLPDPVENFPAVEQPVASVDPEDATAFAAVAWPAWQTVAGGVWVTGSAVWFLLAGWRLYCFRRWLGHAAPAAPELQDRTRRLATGLGLSRGPSVWMTSAPLSPMIWAMIGTPRLLLPSGLWHRLDEGQRDALLLHELAHLRRGDHLVRWLELFALGLYWWHPVAWWARRELREAEEQCCDAWVVWALPNAAPAYAAALVEAAAFLSEGRAALPVGASGVGHVRCLKRRLTMILRVRTPRSLSWVGLTALLLLAVVLLPLGVSGADRPAEKPRPATDEGAEALPEDPLSQARARDQLERDRLDALLLQFNTLYKQGRYAEAEKVAQEAVKMAPDDPRALAAVALSRAMQRPPASPPPPEEVQAARREQLERARDEVELLEAQLATKKAQLGAAKVAYEAAVQLAQSAKTEAAIAEAEREATVQQAQVRVREAELLEPELRLKQARRRLQALEQAGRSKPNLPTPGSPPSTDDDRLREVERKLDRLLREIESLRRDVPRKQSDRGEEPSDTIRINERNFDIPIRVDPDRAGQIRELLLFVSDDRGASWRQAASAAPTDDRISFTAPRDGEYWFSLCIVNKQGVREPQTPQGHPPANKILVDTKAQ